MKATPASASTAFQPPKMESATVEITKPANHWMNSQARPIMLVQYSTTHIPLAPDLQSSAQRSSELCRMLARRWANLWQTAGNRSGCLQPRLKWPTTGKNTTAAGRLGCLSDAEI